jgi:beta-mannosidase
VRNARFIPHSATHPDDLPGEGWREVSLPHQWALDGLEVEVGWYRIELPTAETGRRRWVRLLADYYAEAWLEEVHLGQHEGYFEPWVLPLPEAGETLWLRVAAPKEPYGSVWPRFKRQIKGIFGHHDCRPGSSSPRGQERGTGGLWGGLETWTSGEVALLGLRALPLPIAGGWRLQLEAEVAREGAARELIAAIDLTPDNFSGESLGTDRKVRLLPGRQRVRLFWQLPEMSLWEVWERGFPHLYRLTLGIENAQIEANIGFRTVELRDDWLYLNGRKLFLRGTNVSPTQWLAGYSQAQAAADVRLIKEANLNAVRVHAHVTHPAFYQVCDREGVLVWQDMPLQWGYALDDEFAQEAVRQAEALTWVLGNHPAVYLWCASNEPTHNRYTTVPAVSAALGSSDPTRLVKEASDFREHTYPGWYWGHLRDFLALPAGPLPSEFGAQALPRAETLRQMLGEAAWPPRWDEWAYRNFQAEQTFRVAGVEMGHSLEDFSANSQAYQARLLRFAIEAYRRAKGRITGYFQFMFVEPWDGISWAVVEAHRTPKAGYHALKEASQPVLISLVPYRETTEIGQPPLSEAWLISDLERPLEVLLTFRLEGPVSGGLGEIAASLAPQEARRVFSLMEWWEAPPGHGSERMEQAAQFLRSLSPGEYRLVCEAWEETTLLARGSLDVTYLAPIVPMEPAW